MRIISIPRLLVLALSSMVFFSCNEKEDFVSDSLTDYMPLAPGKYITYRIDSLVFPNFGRNIEVHKYQVKHQVDALITDNLGRPAYRVYRFVRDSAGTQPWQPNGTYLVTILADQAEVSDDNLRIIKLHLPVRNGFSWKGNRYLPYDTIPGSPEGSYDPLYDFDNDDEMADWDFYYDGDPVTFSYKGINYNNVVTVEQIDEAFNVPITNPAFYASRSRAVDKYAKGIGLVYKELELWEHQPNTGGAGGPYKTGFGITMWMIDHN